MFTNVSPKVIWSTFAAVIATGVLAMLGYLQTPDGVLLFAGLPLIAVIGIKAAVTAAATALTGYVVTDPLRAKGEVAEAAAYGGEHMDDGGDEPQDDITIVETDDELVAYEPQRALVEDHPEN